MDHSPDALTSPAVFDGIAAAVLDANLVVKRWSRTATELLGYPAQEVIGVPARRLLCRTRGSRPPPSTHATGHGSRVVTLRHHSGQPVVVSAGASPLVGGGHEVLVLAVALEQALLRDHQCALGRALLQQDRMDVVLRDLDLRVLHANTPSRDLGNGGYDGQGLLSLRDLRAVGAGATGEDVLREVIRGGTTLAGTDQLLKAIDVTGHERVFSLTAVRLEDPTGRPMGVAASTVDVTAGHRAWQELELVYESSVRIGGSLDVERTAQDLADVLVPALGDMASVDLPDAVLRGHDPPLRAGGDRARLRRVATRAAGGDWPAGMVQPGELIPSIPDRPEFHPTEHGGVIVSPSTENSRALLGHDARLISLMVPEGMHASMGIPLFARGRSLGFVLVYRTEDEQPFDESDEKLLRSIVTRAALAVDNARRYSRERRTAEVLQRSLLPPVSSDTAAAETAGVYLPAGGASSVGGDWYDVIPLSSLRIALVVGDVIGHGLQATATMARVRTAVQTLADLDLGPDELLTRVDDLVQRFANEAEEPDAVGASCVYAVYDPVTGLCQVASAGHPAPAVVSPDGEVGYLDIVPGPPLGVGGMPFEMTEVSLAPGSVLALYSDGLIDRERNTGLAPQSLRERLVRFCRPSRSLTQIGREIVVDDALTPPADDVTLLLARTRCVPARNTVHWEFPPVPEAVGEAREKCVRQLEQWGLHELAFTTELVISELVTNAVRYAGSVVGVRLTVDRVLVCEVSDSSNSQPRLRRSLSTDEGGRGLFLVAQLTDRWGSRYTSAGKTIWAEQSISFTG